MQHFFDQCAYDRGNLHLLRISICYKDIKLYVKFELVSVKN